jgi:hypothetical protein
MGMDTEMSIERNRLAPTLTALVLFSFLFPSFASAWDEHFLISRVAVECLGDELPILETQVAPTTLAAFVKKNNVAVKNSLRVFHEWKKMVYLYPQWMLSSTHIALLHGRAPITPAQFLEILGVSATAFSKVVFLKEYCTHYGPAMTNPQTPRSFGDWLILFSDEPDWGMDLSLFGKGDGRYGEIPYGDAEGTGSQAPFHMTFSHESWITYQLKPSLKQGMGHLRFVVFLNLAQVAMRAGDLYWTARFLGNAIHYMQDVSVPYHSSAVPFLNPLIFVKAIVAKDKERFNREKTQLLSNRHLLYELIAGRAQALSFDSIEKLFPSLQSRINTLAEALSVSGAEGNTRLYARFFSGGKIAFGHAHKVDKLIGKAFPKKLIGDPNYDPFANGPFDLSPYFPDAMVQDWLDGKRSKNTQILEEIRKDLFQAVEGVATILLTVLRR